MQFLNPSKMNSPSPSKRHNITMTRHGRRSTPKISVNMHTNPELVRTRGGMLDVPRELKLMSSCNDQQQPHQKLTKLLLNVNIHNSLGPVQVVMLPENNVEDLIKAAIDAYVKEKRRPLLACADTRCFQLHYSQFSLESLKKDEKLMNLGSRNFFLCPNPNNAAAPDELKAEMDRIRSSFPLIKLMDFLL